MPDVTVKPVQDNLASSFTKTTRGFSYRSVNDILNPVRLSGDILTDTHTHFTDAERDRLDRTLIKERANVTFHHIVRESSWGYRLEIKASLNPCFLRGGISVLAAATLA
jgi:hypothetical protein